MILRGLSDIELIKLMQDLCMSEDTDNREKADDIRYVLELRRGYVRAREQPERIPVNQFVQVTAGEFVGSAGVVLRENFDKTYDVQTNRGTLCFSRDSLVVVERVI